MKNKIFRKTLVIIIILLFFGMSLVNTASVKPLNTSGSNIKLSSDVDDAKSVFPYDLSYSKYGLIIGYITNLSEEDNYYVFEAVLIIFLPFGDISRYYHNHVVINVSKDGIIYITESFIFGFSKILLAD